MKKNNILLLLLVCLHSGMWGMEGQMKEDAQPKKIKEEQLVIASPSEVSRALLAYYGTLFLIVGSAKVTTLLAKKLFSYFAESGTN